MIEGEEDEFQTVQNTYVHCNIEAAGKRHSQMSLG
jgi:hypothetical protein